jgi:hypothetical protein
VVDPPCEVPLRTYQVVFKDDEGLCGPQSHRRRCSGLTSSLRRSTLADAKGENVAVAPRLFQRVAGFAQ